MVPMGLSFFATLATISPVTYTFAESPLTTMTPYPSFTLASKPPFRGDQIVDPN